MNLVHDYRFLVSWCRWKFIHFVKDRKMWNKICGGTSNSSTMATFSVPLKTFMFHLCSFIKKFNEYTTKTKELIFSSPLLLKNTHTFSPKRVEAPSHWEIFHIQLALYKWYLYPQQQQSSAPHIGVLSIEVRSLFWTEFSNVKWTNLNKSIETGAAIFASLRARIIFIFTRVSRECQRRQKQRDVLIFRAFFVFTRPITHAQFKNCRTWALKNRKPQKWHPEHRGRTHCAWVDN